MAINKDLFSVNNFQSTIRGYCNRIGWGIAELNSNKAVLRFGMDSGTTQTVFIIRYETTLEFSCPTGLKFSGFDAIPHQLSSYMLKENSKYKIGFWCIEELSNRQVFSIMHNAEMSLIDINYFLSIVKTLVQKCENLEQAAEQGLRGI